MVKSKSPHLSLRSSMAGDFPIEKLGPCVVITLNRGENRLNNNFISALHKALDKAESYEDATCLVTIGEDKFYSLGLDLDWLATLDDSGTAQFYGNLQKLFSRLLVFPLVTVAAMNGHSYAGGALLTICHDYIIMRTRRGWFCFPEVRIKRTFSIGTFNLVKSKVPHSEQHQAIVLGRRYTAEEALSGKMINEICPVEQLKEKAIAAALRLAGKDGLDRSVLSVIKQDMYRDTYEAFMKPVSFYSKL